jgi:hypothetical protein
MKNLQEIKDYAIKTLEIGVENPKHLHFEFAALRVVARNIIKLLNDNPGITDGENKWIRYYSDHVDHRPIKADKYFVHRKDGKIHWETWNGSGWAYNENVITHWMIITPPLK